LTVSSGSYILIIDSSYLLLLFDELKQISSGTVLKNDPQMIPGLIPVKELQYVPVLKVVEDADLRKVN